MGSMSNNSSTRSTQVQPFGQAHRIIEQSSHQFNEASLKLGRGSPICAYGCPIAKPQCQVYFGEDNTDKQQGFSSEQVWSPTIGCGTIQRLYG